MSTEARPWAVVHRSCQKAGRGLDAPKQVPGHCCPYCVNPNIGFEAPVEGATGKYGGKKSVECPNVPAGALGAKEIASAWEMKIIFGVSSNDGAPITGN